MPPKRLSRDESQARTRERLLNAAARLFVKHGLDGTSVDDITAAAGFTKGAFYANFESKEQALLELMDRHGRESRGAGLELPGPDAGALKANVRAHTLEHAHHVDWLILGVEFKLAATRNPKLKTKYLAARRALVAEGADALKRVFTEAGRRLVADPALICTALEVIIEGLALLRRIDGEAVSAANADAILDLFIDRILFASDASDKSVDRREDHK